MQNYIDTDLLDGVEVSLRETGKAVLHDPRYPFQVRVRRNRLGWLITTEKAGPLPWWRSRRLADHQYESSAKAANNHHLIARDAQFSLNYIIELDLSRQS